MPTRQARHWCWTLNNYSPEEEKHIQQLGENLKQHEINYIIFGQEKGENQTPHLQGYISFEKRKSFGVVKKLLSPRIHLEASKGSPNQNKAYCSKGENIKEYGQIPRGQGARTDLVALAQACKAGASLKQIADHFPSATIRYSTGIIRLKQIYQQQRTGPPELWCLWGKTGTGKTRRVWQYANIDMLWVHPGDRWFDGYDGQPAVLFDDFDGSWFKITYLLKLIDRYAFTVPIKGAYVNWVPKVIYFTSNLHPKEWYPNAKQDHVDALIRRFREFGHIEQCT
jgi:hypothetical protein